MRYYLYQWFWTALDWLYPPNCGGCETLGVRWCPDCYNNTRRVLPPFCDLCGQILRVEGVCARCAKTPPRFTAVRSWAIFGGSIRNALHRLKYRRDVALGEVLSRPLIEYMQQVDWNLDLVVPVPLGVARKRERGYNQAALLAKPLALKLALAYRPRALSRIRETQSQVTLGRVQRRQNVAGAFQARSTLVTGKNVLLIDDVTTSGATLDSCADALLQAGADEIYGLTLARAK